MQFSLQLRWMQSAVQKKRGDGELNPAILGAATDDGRTHNSRGSDLSSSGLRSVHL